MSSSNKGDVPPDLPQSRHPQLLATNPSGHHHAQAVVKKLTKTEQKKLEKEKAAERVRECLQRKASGESIRPRIKYQQVERATRGNYVPVILQQGSKNGDSSRTVKKIINCSVDEAIFTFKTGILLDWETITSCDSIPVSGCDNENISQQRPAKVQMKDDEDAPFMMIVPAWVSIIRNQLNQNPFNRSATDSKKLQLYNNGWRNWILHQCALCVTQYITENGQDESTGEQKFVFLKEVLHINTGIIAVIRDKFKESTFGPLLPLPSLKPANLSPTKVSPNNQNENLVSNEESTSEITVGLTKSSPLPHPAHRREALTFKDSPFDVIYGQPEAALFGKMPETGEDILNQDMKCFLPGNMVTVKMTNILGQVLSYISLNQKSIASASSSRIKFKFIPSDDIFDAIQTEDITKKDESRTRVRRMLTNSDGKGGNVNIVVTYFNLSGEGYIIVSDITSHDIKVYHPSHDVGIITRSPGTEELCNWLVAFGKLFAILKMEKEQLWVPNPQSWKSIASPSYLGGALIKTSGNDDLNYSIDASIYNLMFIESIGIGKNTFLNKNHDPVEYKRNGEIFGWDFVRSRYFNYVTDFLRKNGTLSSQPGSFSQIVSEQHKTKPEVKSVQDSASSSSVATENASLAIKPVTNMKDHKVPEVVQLDNDNDQTVSPSSQIVTRTVTIVKLSDIAKLTSKELEQIVGKITSPSCEILYKDFWTLLPGKWLNDSIILAIMSSIHARSRGMEGARSFVFTDSLNAKRIIRGIIKKPQSGRPNSIYELVRKMILMKLLIMPYNYAESHWLLFIVDYDTRTVYAYNPYNQDGDQIREEAVRTALSRIATCVTNVMNEITAKSNEDAKLEFTSVMNYASDSRMPIQLNDTWNCGVFIMSFLELFVNSTDFDSENCNKMGSTDFATKTDGANALRTRYYYQVLDSLITK